MSASTRASLEAIPLLGAVELRGVPVRRTSLLSFRVGDVEHDLDGAEAVLEGLSPLRGPVESLGKYSEVWLLVPGSRANARVQQLRAALRTENVTQELVRAAKARGFTAGGVDKLSLIYSLPAGAQIPPVRPRSISSNFRKPGADEESMGILSSGRAA